MNNKINLSILGLESYLSTNPKQTIADMLKSIDISSTVLRRMLKASKHIESIGKSPMKFYNSNTKVVSSLYDKEIARTVSETSQIIIMKIDAIHSRIDNLNTVLEPKLTKSDSIITKQTTIAEEIIIDEKVNNDIIINPDEFEKWCSKNFKPLYQYFSMGNSFDKIGKINPVMFEQGVRRYLKHLRQINEEMKNGEA